jgi:PAS domain S-box-containing protein
LKSLWRPAGVVLALLAALTFLLWRSSSPDQQLDARMQKALQAFRLHDAELTRDVLLDRAGLLPNLDTLMYDRRNMQDSVDELRRIGGSGTHAAQTAMTRQLDELSAVVQERLVPVERFKSANALLRKSLLYLTYLGPVLRVSLQDQNLAAEIGRLSYAVLRYMQATDTDIEADIQEVLARLSRASAPQSELRTLVAHGQLIERTLPQVDALMRSIVSAPTTAKAEQLATALRDYQNVIDARTHYTLALTYLVAVILLAYLVYQSARLISSDLRFRAITESTREAIVSVDTRGRVRSWNLGAAAMFGYRPEQILGRDALVLLAPAHHAAFHERLELLAAGSSAPASAPAQEFSGRRASGEEFPSEISLSAWTTFQGRFATAIVRDVGDRKVLEARTRAQELRLIQADRMSTLGTLVASVAHDIKGPTQVVLQNSQNLARAWSDAAPVLDHHWQTQQDFLLGGVAFSRMRQRVPELIGDLGDSALEIKSFVGDMLAFARPPQANDPESFSLNQTVQRAARLLGGAIKQRTNRFSMALAGELPPAHGNAQLFCHIVVNLLSNALQSLPDRERGVSVNTSFDPVSGHLVLVVADEGVGIDAEQLSQLGVQSVAGDRAMDTSGLGLTLTAELLRAQGGKLAFESEPGRGTRAIVTALPAVS